MNTGPLCAGYICIYISTQATSKAAVKNKKLKRAVTKFPFFRIKLCIFSTFAPADFILKSKNVCSDYSRSSNKWHVVNGYLPGNPPSPRARRTT